MEGIEVVPWPDEYYKKLKDARYMMLEARIKDLEERVKTAFVFGIFLGANIVIASIVFFG